ncbi:MAG TPA: MFS transporter [Terriglobia bacterium]|nr:MFS transporter [Terriglobia bacterium]
MTAVRKTQERIKIGYAWTAVGLLWFAFMVNYVDRQVVFSIFPVLKKELHFSEAQLGLIGLMFLWTYSACMPFMGRLADMVERRRLVIWSIVLWSAATIGTAVSRSTTSFLAWRAVMGLVEAAYVPAAVGLIAVIHSERTRSTALAIHGTAQFAGIAIGGWVGGWLAETIGWRTGFWILSAIGIIYAGILSNALHSPPLPLQRTQQAQSSAFNIFKSRCFNVLLISFFVLCAMLWMFYGWLPDFVFNKFHLSLAGSGFAGTAYLQAGSVVGILIWGRVTDMVSTRTRAARYYASALGLAICAPFAYLVLATVSLSLLKLACLLFGFFSGAFIANVFAAAYEVVPKENYAFSVGVLNFAGGLAGGVGVYLIGLSHGPGGMAGLMGGNAVLAVVMGLALALVAGRNFRNDYQHVTPSRE